MSAIVEETRDTILCYIIVKFEVIAFPLVIINWWQTWNQTNTSYLLLLRNANPLDIILFYYSYAPLELFTDFVRCSVECLAGHHTSCMSSTGQLHVEMFVVRAGWKPRPTNEHREVLFMDTFSSVSR